MTFEVTPFLLGLLIHLVKLKGVWRSCFARLWALDDMDSKNYSWWLVTSSGSFMCLAVSAPPVGRYFVLKASHLALAFLLHLVREMPTKRHHLLNQKNHPTGSCFAFRLTNHRGTSHDFSIYPIYLHPNASNCHLMRVITFIQFLESLGGCRGEHCIWVAFLSGMHSMEGLEHFMVMGFCSSTQMNIANQPTIMANDRTSCHYSRH